jgi:PadR family transcriptional regulator, regulatory protein AphA
MSKSSKSKFAILGMLALKPGSSGYDIKKLMEKSTEYFWMETFSSIYPVLQELVKEELIEAQDSAAIPSTKRERHTYALTKKGHLALQEWLAISPAQEQIRSELLLKLFFGNLAPPIISLKHIKEYQAELLGQKEIFVEIRKKLLSLQKDDSGAAFRLMTLELGIKQLEATLIWCQETLQKIQELENKAKTSHVKK